MKNFKQKLWKTSDNLKISNIFEWSIDNRTSFITITIFM